MPPQPRTNASKFMVELYQILGDWGIFWGRIPPGGGSASTLVVVLVCFPWLRCFALAQKRHHYNPLREGQAKNCQPSFSYAMQALLFQHRLRFALFC